MLRLLIILLLFASPVHSGAWPREQGTSFATGTVRLVWPRDLSTSKPQSTYVTLYYEYGLTDRLTLGLDLGHSVSGDGKTTGFLRVPLTVNSNWVAAVELGGGLINDRQVLRPSLSLGRGLSGRHGAGWLSVDSSLEIDLSDGATDMKVDMTYGTTLPKGRKLILQVQTGVEAGQNPFVRLAPSIVTPLRNGLQIEAGVTLGLTDNTGIGMMFGLWRDF